MSIINRNQGGTGGVTFVDMKGTPQEYTKADGTKAYGSFLVSTGKGQPKEVLPSNSAITGFVTGIDVQQSDYKGEKISSLKIKMEDPEAKEPPVLLTVALGSYFGAKVVGLLNAADLSRPISFNANVAMAGEKVGDKVMDKDNVFPTARGADQQRLIPVYAGGAAVLPETPKVTISGKVHSDMTPVNNMVVETIKEIYGKLDALTETGPHDTDHGIDPNEVAGAAERPAAQRG